MPPLEPSTMLHWKPLLLCPHPVLARRVGMALFEMGMSDTFATADYPKVGDAEAIALQQRSNICFLDVATDAEGALSLMPEILPLMPVVVLHSEKDADLILRCLRRGACEFLADPTSEAVRGVFERLGRGRTPQKSRGTVYCTVPGKPGCGASTVAVHLALHLESNGKRKVLLVDTDPLAGSIGFMLKLKAGFHLGDVARDWSRMDDDLWRRLRTPFSGIHVLPAPEVPVGHIDMEHGLAEEMVSFWREQYDATVIDSPDLRVAAESGFAAAADQILLVTTNELASVHATRRGIEFLDQALGDRSRLRLIVNRYTPAMGLKREDIQAVLQMEPFALLSSDYELVQDALLEGKPVASRSKFRSSIQALSRQLAGDVAVDKKQGSWFERLHLRK
jgi:pilus assembly protein CpaE